MNLFGEGREIYVDEMRARKGIPLNISEMAGQRTYIRSFYLAGLGECRKGVEITDIVHSWIERSSVQPEVGSWNNCVGPAETASLTIDVLILRAKRIGRRERQTRFRSPRTVQRKSVNDLIDPTREIATDALVPAKGQIPVAKHYKYIATVVVAIPIIHTGIIEVVVGLVRSSVRPRVVAT